MNDNLIGKLSILNLQKNYLKRELDINCYNKAKREVIFKKMENIDKEIKYVKFKLELERKIKK